MQRQPLSSNLPLLRLHLSWLVVTDTRYSQSHMTTCTPKLLILSLFIISAIPVGFIISLERSKHATHLYQYHSHRWIRESTKWDDVNRRFIVSYFEGGVGKIAVPDNHSPEMILKEETVVKDSDLAGNSSLGLFIDRPRNRVLVVTNDMKGYSYAALAAYDLDTWNRVYLAQLSQAGDEKSLADDVIVDTEGNAYVTDAKSSKIWKVGLNGDLLSVIRSSLFAHDKWYKDIVAVNGIVYHPDGFLIVIHTMAGELYKIDVKTQKVKLIRVVGSLVMGDGMELLSPSRLVVVGIYPSARLVETLDGWETATVIAKYFGPVHRLAAGATVKDGKLYVNHLFGLGFPKTTHVITEVVFTPC